MHTTIYLYDSDSKSEITSCACFNIDARLSVWRLLESGRLCNVVYAPSNAWKPHRSRQARFMIDTSCKADEAITFMRIRSQNV